MFVCAHVCDACGVGGDRRVCTCKSMLCFCVLNKYVSEAYIRVRTWKLQENQSIKKYQNLFLTRKFTLTIYQHVMNRLGFPVVSRQQVDRCIWDSRDWVCVDEQSLCSVWPELIKCWHAAQVAHCALLADCKHVLAKAQLILSRRHVHGGKIKKI